MPEKVLNHLKKMQVDGVHKYLIFYASADNWNPWFYYHLLLSPVQKSNAFIHINNPAWQQWVYVVVKCHELFITLYGSYS